MESGNITARSLHSLSTRGDAVMHFENLRQNITKKLKMDNWIVAPSSQNLYIFNLNKKSNGNLSIRNTINIDLQLTAKVFLNNDTTFHLKISRWSLLQSMIDRFGHPAIEKVSEDLVCIENSHGNDMEVGVGSGDVVMYEFCAVDTKLEDKDQKSEYAVTAPDKFRDTISTELSDPIYNEPKPNPIHANVTLDETSGLLLQMKTEPPSSELDDEPPYSIDLKDEPQISNTGLDDPLHAKDEPSYTSLDDFMFSCTECGKSYDQNAKLIRHKRIHQSHVCPLCNENFIGRIDLHIRKHRHKQSRCDRCGTECRNASLLAKHMEMKHTKAEEFFCDICSDGRNYESKASIEWHIKYRHNNEGKNVEDFQLEWMLAHGDRKRKANASTSNDSGKLSTKLSKKSPQWCDICQKFLRGNLPRHMASVHSDKKDYVCDFCGVAFSHPNSLQAHITIRHTDKGETFYCQICRNGQPFRARSYLKKHLAAHVKAGLNDGKTVTKTNEWYKCNFCDEMLPSKYTLKGHTTLKHSDEVENAKVYKCRVCDKKFGMQSALTIHEKLHSGDQYVCNYCGQSFHHPNYLRKHLRRHEKPPEKKACTMCDKKYANGFDLRSHLKKIHNVVVQTKRVPPNVECNDVKSN